jgi:hypothetical protein
MVEIEAFQHLIYLLQGVGGPYIIAVRDNAAQQQSAVAGQQGAVLFDNGQGAGGFQQRQGNGALTGADFNQVLAAGRLNGRHDLADHDRVMQEVLSEPFPWTVTQGVILVLVIINSRL